MKIVVGVDGSEGSARAVAWCVEHAGPLGAEVVAVHAVELPLYADAPYPFVLPQPFSEEALEGIARTLREEWCKPLADAQVPFRAVVTPGYPPKVLIDAARDEAADLVVTGRRGLGGFKELLLGSTTHHLAHHLDRPLLIVP